MSTGTSCHGEVRSRPPSPAIQENQTVTSKTHLRPVQTFGYTASSANNRRQGGKDKHISAGQSDTAADIIRKAIPVFRTQSERHWKAWQRMIDKNGTSFDHLFANFICRRFFKQLTNISQKKRFQMKTLLFFADGATSGKRRTNTENSKHVYCHRSDQCLRRLR